MTTTADHTATLDPIVIANELITLGDRATDEGRAAAPYLDLAEEILNAVEAEDDRLAAHLTSDAIAWLAR